MPCFVSQQHAHRSPYDAYPSDQDGFHFMPCTERAVLPALDDLSPLKTWQSRFDPNPEHWSWGPAPNKTHSTLELQKHDRYGDRGIFLCGYMDLPMDYTNKSDQRIVRLAVTKYQVSGLALRRPRSPRFWRRSGNVESTLRRGVKSAQTLVGEPGGPGGSGTSFAWRVGPDWSARFTNSTQDVLAWDPRGVNASLPSISCYPYDADRDRWYLLASQYRASGFNSPDALLRTADAVNEATMQACQDTMGDFPRFISTAFVARDVDEIRKRLGEETISGYFVSYGTGIGQSELRFWAD